MQPFVLRLILLVLCFTFNANTYKNKDNTRKPKFSDFVKKYSLAYRYKQAVHKVINKKPVHFGVNVYDAIDPTEDLLKFDVDQLPSLAMPSRRQMRPAHDLLAMREHRDVWQNRMRLYELMKQTMYVARDKLLVINGLRERYRNNSLFKMGYLFSKTDDQTKLFSQLAFKGYMVCKACRERANDTYARTSMTDVMEIIERLLSHWLETDLLADVIYINDYAARDALERWRGLPDLKSWFIDEFFNIYQIEFKLKAEKKKMQEEAKKIEEEKRQRLEKLREEMEEKQRQEEEKRRKHEQQWRNKNRPTRKIPGWNN